LRNCTALLGLLESSDIDYTFEYESVAIQHELGFVVLPEEIDLSTEDFFDRYPQVRV
jgi:molybdate/tungstate transport system substrate-binding protein